MLPLELTVHQRAVKILPNRWKWEIYQEINTTQLLVKAKQLSLSRTHTNIIFSTTCLTFFLLYIALKCAWLYTVSLSISDSYVDLTHLLGASLRSDLCWILRPHVSDRYPDPGPLGAPDRRCFARYSIPLTCDSDEVEPKSNMKPFHVNKHYWEEKGSDGHTRNKKTSRYHAAYFTPHTH